MQKFCRSACEVDPKIDGNFKMMENKIEGSFVEIVKLANRLKKKETISQFKNGNLMTGSPFPQLLSLLSNMMQILQLGWLYCDYVIE